MKLTLIPQPNKIVLTLTRSEARYLLEWAQAVAEKDPHVVSVSRHHFACQLVTVLEVAEVEGS